VFDFLVVNTKARTLGEVSDMSFSQMWEPTMPPAPIMQVVIPFDWVSVEI